MAVTIIRSVNKDVAQSIEYIINPAKTDDGFLVTSNLCVSEPHETAEQFKAVRQGIGGGKATIKAKHIIQSFAPSEVTPEQAMLIAQELCLRLLKDEYQYVLAVYNDHDHIHAHIVFNNVNMFTGNTFETEYNQGKKSERAWAKVRQISDEICRENNLSVIENPSKDEGVSHFEREMQKEGKSWKSKLRAKIIDIIKVSRNFDEFLENCKNFDIEAVYNPTHKIDLKFRMKGQQRFTRAKTLGEEYTTEAIKRMIKTYWSIPHPETKSQIINTETEKMQSSPNLKRWANIQNIKQLSKAFNIITQYNISDENGLDSIIKQRYPVKFALAQEMDTNSKAIKELEERIRVAKTAKQYSYTAKQSRSLTERKKAKYDEENSYTLSLYKDAVQQLKKWYPDGNVPTPEFLEKKLEVLEIKHNELSKQYSALKAEIKQLDYARRTIHDYYRNEQKREHKKKLEL